MVFFMTFLPHLLMALVCKLFQSWYYLRPKI